MAKFISMFYKFLHIATSVDFGFITFKSFKTKCIVNFVLVIRAVSFSVGCLIQTYNDETLFVFVRHGLHIFQYLIHILIFMLMKRDVTLSGCLSIFKNVDSKLYFIKDECYGLEMRNLSVVSFCLALRLTWTCTLCIGYDLCLTGVFKNIFYFFVFVLRDIVVILNVFVFYFIKCRLGTFINFLEMENVNIISFHRLYKNISDIALRLKQTYDSLFTNNLIFNVSNVMCFTYFAVTKFINGNILIWEVGLGCGYLVLVDLIALTLSPALFAGTLSSQTDQIIHILQLKLLECQDKTEARHIKNFIRYVEAHPMKFMVYKVIPLDARLAGMVFSFIITYIIVILQFSHVY